MKQQNKNVCYKKLGEDYCPSQECNKERAVKYAQAITHIQEIGMGADECLGEIRDVLNLIRRIALIETGYELENYESEYRIKPKVTK